jgi:hypothetical protein
LAFILLMVIHREVFDFKIEFNTFCALFIWCYIFPWMPRSPTISPVWFPKSFIVLHFIFRFTICSQLSVAYGWQIVLALFMEKDLLSLLSCLYSFLKCHLTMSVWTYFWALFCVHWSVCLFH